MAQRDGTELDREWRQAERTLAQSPAEGLATLDRLAAELLRQHGYDTEATSGDDVDLAQVARVNDPEMLLTFIEARAVTSMLESGRTTGKETIGLALEAYRGIYETLAGSEQAQP